MKNDTILNFTQRKHKLIINLFALLFISPLLQMEAQEVLFDFDAAPVYTPFPIDQTAGGITAHFSGTGEGYSIQDANTMGFTPDGFGGHCIYPGSVFLADLLISFDKTLTDFSILYACQELGCDDAATMRVSAFLNGVFVGTNTEVAANPGTWPSATLSCSFASGFDSVVVHYDSPPPTCSDYGVIFMADNMRVTPMEITGIENKNFGVVEIFPNPATESAVISFSILQNKAYEIDLLDINGKLITHLFHAELSAGAHQINLKLNNELNAGIYFLNFRSETFSVSRKLVIVK